MGNFRAAPRWSPVPCVSASLRAGTAAPTLKDGWTRRNLNGRGAEEAAEDGARQVAD